MSAKALRDFRKVYSLPALCLALFMALAVVSCVEGSLFYLHPVIAAQNTDDRSRAADRLESESAKLQVAIKSVEDRMDALQKLLGVLTAVGTILGLAVAAFGYINLKEIQDNAQKALSKQQTDANKVFSELRTSSNAQLEEIRADFPAIGYLNRSVRRLLTELQATLGHWQESYGQMTPADKERMFVAEMTFAALQLFSRADSARQREISKINRGFGRFYASVHIELAKRGSAPDRRGEFERAIFYFERAAEWEDGQAVAYRDLGFLYIEQSKVEKTDARKAEFRKHAETHLRLSLERNPSEPGSLRGMAWVQRQENRMPDALTSLSALIAKQN